MRNDTPTGTPAHAEPSPILLAIERSISFLQSSRDGSARQRDIAPACSPAEKYHDGCIRAFDLSLAELRNLAGEVAA